MTENSFVEEVTFKGCFNNRGYKMSAKLVTLGLLKIKVVWNRGYDVIVFIYDVTNKIYHVTHIIL